jgi:hypothetical protein
MPPAFIKTWRLEIVNQTGADLPPDAIVARLLPYTINAAGQVICGPMIEVIAPGDDSDASRGIEDAHHGGSNDIDNSVDGYTGGVLSIDIDLSGVTITRGIKIRCFIENSANDGDTWPEHGSGQLIREFTTVASNGHAHDTLVL